MVFFEFTVEGPPVSHQSRKRANVQAWKQAVRAAAKQGWNQASPVAGPVRMTITYFHEGDAIRMDNDNMAKPIQDALNGLIYQDDRQITHLIVRKANIDGLFEIRGVSSVVLEAFSMGEPFVHVKVETAPPSKDMLK